VFAAGAAEAEATGSTGTPAAVVQTAAPAALVDPLGHAVQAVATAVEAVTTATPAEYVLAAQLVQTTLAVLVPTEAR